MRLTRHVLPLSLFMLASCGGQDQISGTDGSKSASDILAAREVAPANNSAEHQYQVTIENMTTGQVFSPGVIATHTASSSVWEAGSPASEGIRVIAEEGFSDRSLTDLAGTSGIFEVIPTGGPINRIGGPAMLGVPSRTYTINGSANANRLSVAVMIICTNDGFTGVSGVKLPGGFKPETHLVGAWDAGTEQNNQLFSQIVDPCQAAGPVTAPADGNGRIATNGVIETHPNITPGVGNLTAAHRWQFPVARITVQRLK